MLFVALFVALFLVACLYYILGIGDALLYRRVMQEGADSGAFAASVVAAKGMNFHALLNVVMAVTAGILLVIRAVEVFLEILISILAALAATVVLAPKAAPLIAAITPAESAVERVGDGVEQFVRVAHDALDGAHLAIQRGYPLLAEARAIELMSLEGGHDPPVVAGFVVPVLGPRLPSGARGLPVESLEIGALCDRAANSIRGRIENVRTALPGWLMRFLGGALAKALLLGKRRTCDDDVVEPPRAALSLRSDGSEVWLGHEEYQYRAYAIGSDPHSGKWSTGEEGIRLAQGGRDLGRNYFHAAQVIGRIAVAQSEFYFDGTEPRSEWLWRQRWRARLRRFRISRGRLPTGLTSACAAARVHGSRRGLPSVCDVIRDFTTNAISAH